MTNHAPIFRVTVDAKGLAIGKIDSGHRSYRKAGKSAILRQRDAIELFRKLEAADKDFSGTYCFHILDSARTFALLCLQAQEKRVQDNLDRVLAYDGTAKPARR